jgi:hypothetical protein
MASDEDHQVHTMGGKCQTANIQYRLKRDWK